jgi:hypothetical protein
MLLLLAVVVALVIRVALILAVTGVLLVAVVVRVVQVVGIPRVVMARTELPRVLVVLRSFTEVAAAAAQAMEMELAQAGRMLVTVVRVLQQMVAHQVVQSTLVRVVVVPMDPLLVAVA